jgi:hypothetical protein
MDTEKTVNGAGESSPATDGSAEPLRVAYSREEIIHEAKSFMIETYGACYASDDKDRWHERFGLLVSFLTERFPQNVGLHARFRASHASPGSARCRELRVLDRMHRMGKTDGRLDLRPRLHIRSILFIPPAPCWLPNHVSPT